MSNTKSFSSETSDRYALALYEIGKENNDLEKLSKNLPLVKSLYDNDIILSLIDKSIGKIPP